MITKKARQYIPSSLAALMIYASSGCGTLGNLSNEFKSFGKTSRDPIHEVFRNDEKLNLEPPAMAEATQKLHNDETRQALANPLEIADNGRAYPKGEVPEINKDKFYIPSINANYIDLDGNNDGKGDVLVSYRCRNPAPDLAALLTKYLPIAPKVEITPYPAQNTLLFRGQDTEFGENFGLLSKLINNFDIEPQQIRVRVKIIEYFNDNTYDRDLALNILRNGMSAFSLNLPSNPQGNPLTTGGSLNPFYNTDQNGNFSFFGRIPSKWNFTSAIKFLDSHGKTETLSDTDIVVSNGATCEFKNTNSVPYQQTSLTPAAAIVIGTQYREVGPQLKLSSFANEQGFTTIELLNAKSGESTALLGKEQAPRFRESDLISKFCVQNGITYLIATSANTRYKSVDRGIPGLNKIPIVRSVTTSRENEKNASELLYFMEVYVLDRNDKVGMQEKISEQIMMQPSENPDKAVKQSKNNKKENLMRQSSYQNLMNQKLKQNSNYAVRTGLSPNGSRR